MGRMIAGVLVGYITMFALVFATFSLAYLMLGSEGSFKPDSFEVTGTWLVVSIILSLIAAVGGGLVAGWISRDPRTLVYLAGLVIVLGIGMAIPETMHDDRNDPVFRSSELSNRDAMMQAQQPLWLTFLNPFLGAMGVMVGGGLGRRSDAEEGVGGSKGER